MKPQARTPFETRPEAAPLAGFAPGDGAPHLNAVKHGLRSVQVVLPGEDAAEFQRRRHDLFASYQPRTAEEARAVEDMISCEWRKARCQRWAAAVDGQVDALWSGDPRAGSHCEGDPHRWIHRSNDCEVKEGRLERLMARAHTRLLLLQQQRRNNLIAGAMDVMKSWQELERAGAMQLGLLPGAGRPEARQRQIAPAGRGVPLARSAGAAAERTATPARREAPVGREAGPLNAAEAKASSGGRNANRVKRTPPHWDGTAPDGGEYAALERMPAALPASGS